MKIGVVSDTHGLVRPETLSALAGVEQIIHAGDIGGPEVLAELANVAPVTAVTGNVDQGQPWAAEIPSQVLFEIDGWKVFLLHDEKQIALDQWPKPVDLVISGHSHRPHWRQSDGVSWLNPGSAGRRRFSLPVCLALVELRANEILVDGVELVQPLSGAR
ncbi:MAG: metallophosphoesterase family protein [Immundisolibacteraceae bacterium]|nr:metallophosphoesterase family protein [Immundisolibacteraceae bacterium]